jgi:CubicO group peptidase (beta-lactamase class C family)
MLQGHVHPDFADVARTLRRQIPKKTHGGAAVCVMHRGEVVVDIWGGTRDRQGRPWEEDTVSFSFSTTKGVASTLLHMQVDKGLVDYDTPVAEYWPEFGQNGKERITVRQLMCHEAGLYRVADMVDDASRFQDWKYMTDALATAEPCHEPGTAHGYHGITYGWLVGEIVQRVTGQSFPEALHAQIAEPLGLGGLFCGLPAERLEGRAELVNVNVEQGASSEATTEKLKRRIAWLSRRFRSLRIPIDLREMQAALMAEGMERFDFNAPEVVMASMPALNGMFDARSLCRMYGALAAGGELDGVRLMSPETLRRATQIQNRGMGRVIPLPMHWRLGYHRVPSSRGSFGHFGAGGSGAWCDPERELSVALVLNSGLGTPFGDLRVVQVTRAASRCANRRG